MHIVPVRRHLPAVYADLTLLMSVPKSYLHQRHDGVVALLRALEGQQIIICASRASRELAAGGRTALVDRAAARRRIKKLTGLAEDRIRLPSQNLLTLPGGGVSSLGGFKINTKVIGESLYVTPVNLNSFVNRATISGTLRAVVVAWRDWFRDRPLDGFHRHA